MPKPNDNPKVNHDPRRVKSYSLRTQSFNRQFVARVYCKVRVAYPCGAALETQFLWREVFCRSQAEAQSRGEQTILAAQRLDSLPREALRARPTLRSVEASAEEIRKAYIEAGLITPQVTP